MNLPIGGQKMRAHPAELFPHGIALISPHMDDEVLGCGATLAKLPQKKQIHLIYATDGSQSSLPAARWLGGTTPELSRIRQDEARAAAEVLGIPDVNVHFLDFPDGRLSHYIPKLGRALTNVLKVIRPAHLMVPFRYDRHPDHLAVNRAAISLRQKGDCGAELFEYFVYSNWRLLPQQDIRKYISPLRLLEVNNDAEAFFLKRRALECFKSQTTRFYPWQHRPNLTGALLDEVCRSPEVFLRYDPAFPDTAIFHRARLWIPLAHALEPCLKRGKDRAVAFVQSMRGGSNAE